MSSHEVMKKTLSYIENHLDDKLSLDTIAGALNYSKYYIARVFSQYTESTVYKYIKERRITVAAEKLVKSDQPIIEIAYEAGYNSQQSFTLAFHQVYACTPQSYRKKGIFNPVQTSLNMWKGHYIANISYLRGGRAA